MGGDASENASGDDCEDDRPNEVVDTGDLDPDVDTEQSALDAVARLMVC